MTLSEKGYLYIVYKTCKVLKYVLIANMQDHHYTLHNYQTVVCGTDNMAFACRSYTMFWKLFRATGVNNLKLCYTVNLQ